MNTDLRSLLTEYGCPIDAPIHERIIHESTISFVQLRDQLYLLGSILYEDAHNNVYVATIRSGFGNMNGAVVALQMNGKNITVLAYAKEGLIKQRLCENAISKLEEVAHGKKQNHKSKPKLFFLLILLILLFAGSTMTAKIISDRRAKEAAFQAEVNLTIDATKLYNTAVADFNAQVAEYNKAVSMTCIDNIVGLPKKLDTLTQEDEGYEANAAVVRGDNSKEKIASDTELINEMSQEVAQAIAVVKQITAPSDEWVSQRLSALEMITTTEMVTQEHNPDGLLGKEGGYSSCVYFTILDINPDEVPGASVVEKGTDAGGAVEIYPTLADAEARCDYLSGFDGTVLYSGSYAIVGTMVIRTSFKLTNEQQIELTGLITSALTSI